MAKKKRSGGSAVKRTISAGARKIGLSRTFKCPGDCKSLSVVTAEKMPKNLTIFVD